MGRYWVLLLGLVVGACERKPIAVPAPPPAAVEVARPVVREITEWDDYTGRMAAVESVEVRPRVSGYLDAILFRAGQVVSKGDLLFVIDPRPFRATLAAAEAEVGAARARLELARNSAERVADLVRTRAISAEEFDTRAKAALEAQAALDAAAAQVERARLDVEFTEVRSPIDGRISSHYVTVGNLITGGASAGSGATLLTTIVSMDPIHCLFDVSEQDYLKYTRLAASGSRPSSRERANPVRIALADEPEFSREGTIDFVDNRIDQGTGTMRGRGVFANADHALVPGLFVRVRLIGQTIPNAVLVPDAAIGADQANRVVFTVDEKNIVQQRTVVPGKLFEGLRIIQSGLDGTERVVVGGVQRARPGATVAPEMVEIAVKPAASMPAPPAAGAGR